VLGLIEPHSGNSNVTTSPNRPVLLIFPKVGLV